ncbi:MAG: ABC transporter permease [Chitinivibrionales bacterium]
MHTLNIRWLWAVYSMELRKILSYRADFWIQFLGSVAAQLGVAYYLWKAIFDHRDVKQIQEFTFAGMMLYYLVAPLIGKAVQGADMGTISQEIYEGSLNKYLVYPVSFFRYKLASQASYTTIFLVQFAVAMVLFNFLIGVPDGFTISVYSIIGAVVSIGVAAYVYFVTVASIEMVAFWADNVWSLVVIVRFATGLLGGAMIPLSLFPDWAYAVLRFLPFSYFISFPVRTFLGLNSPLVWAQGMVILIIWAILITALASVVWSRGKYHYTGVGI